MKKFNFGLTARDEENLIVARKHNPQVANDTDMIRKALEDEANNSATPEQIETARKAARKQIAQAAKEKRE